MKQTSNLVKAALIAAGIGLAAPALAQSSMSDSKTHHGVKKGPGEQSDTQKNTLHPVPGKMAEPTGSTMPNKAGKGPGGQSDTQQKVGVPSGTPTNPAEVPTSTPKKGPTQTDVNRGPGQQTDTQRKTLTPNPVLNAK